MQLHRGAGRHVGRRLIFLGGVAVVAAVLSAEMPAVAAPAKGITLVSMRRRTLTAAGVRAAERSQTHGTVSSDRKALTLQGKAVSLVVTTGPEDDMLSYRVTGLRNPTITVERGATVRILFVNTDEDMLHSFRVTTQRAPFPMQPNMGQSAGSPDLPHQTKTTRYGAEMAFRLAPGTYSYVCTVKGHAKGGMYGQMVVQ